MARVLRNRVYETSTTTGTGAITLDGAYAAGFNTFYKAGELVAGDTFPYVITDSLASPTWYEAGEGTLIDATSFSRDVEDSTNNNAPIDLPAGTHIVFLSPLASWLGTLATNADVDDAIADALVPYYTSAQTNSAITSALVPYATTVSVTSAINTALIPYSTSAQINTLLGDYLTITNAAATYATPASVTTQISNATILTSQLSGTLAIGQFADNVITSAKIVSLAASKLTGTVAPANGGMGADTSSLTGIYKFTAGVPSLAVAGTDYLTTVSFAEVTGTATNAQLPTAISGKTITGSTINSTTIGASSATTARFTSVDMTGWLTMANAQQLNWLSSTGTNMRILDVDTGNNVNLNRGNNNSVQFFAGAAFTVLDSSVYTVFQTNVGNFGGTTAYTSGQFSKAFVTKAGAVTHTGNLFEAQPYNSTTPLVSISGSGTTLINPVDGATNGVTNALTIGHNSTGTPAANFGTGLLFTGESSTTDNQNMATIDALWGTETHASRAAALTLNVYSTSTKQEGLRILADSGGVKWGWGSTTPVARQTITGSRGGNAALADLLTKLALTGYIIDSTTA